MYTSDYNKNSLKIQDTNTGKNNRPLVWFAVILNKINFNKS